MRIFLKLAVSAAIVVGAYVMTFGLPDPVSAMLGNQASAPAAATGNGSGSAAQDGPRTGQARGRGAGSKATSVVTTPLTLQPYTSVLKAMGTAKALRNVNVVSTTGDTVIEANLTANRQVEAGEVLLRFDARTQRLNLEIAQANLEQVNETVARYEGLRVNGNSTITDVAMSEARLSQKLAEAAVGLAQVALDDRTIRAPIAGRLGLSDIGVGDVLSANSVITSIDQSDAVLVDFELPERAIGLLSEATEVLASTSSFTGRVFTGEIVSFDSRIDSVTRSVTVKARIENTDGLLWPGMTFSVRLIQESEPLPALPSTAITWSRAGSSVWIDVNGTAQQVPVTILFRRGETVWIDAEIKEATQVVTEGAQKLRLGARISTPDGGKPDPTAGLVPAANGTDCKTAASDACVFPTPKEPA